MALVQWDPGFKKTLKILSGQTETDVLDLISGNTRYVWNITILGPAALTGTITIEVSDTDSESGVFRTLQSAGVDVNCNAGKAIMLDPVVTGALKLVSSIAEAADRDFIVMANPRR